MEWCQRFPMDSKPSMEEIGSAVGTSLWLEITGFLEDTYEIQPLIEYSKCSMQRGWNVKYKKGSRPLCTLYPQEGSFACMVSVGIKEAQAAELLLVNCDPYTQELYRNTALFNGGRWLMMAVTTPAILEDVKKLIALRVKMPVKK